MSNYVPLSQSSLVLHADGSFTYSYGPPGVSGLFRNYYALLCAVFVSIGGLSFGYDQGVIANVLVMKDFVQRWPITPLEKGIMTAVLELGALLGALLAGVFADKYSRRRSIFLSCLVFCIGGAFQAAAQSLTHIFIGRAIGGVGVGALSMLAPLYMAEISPPEVRGSLMSLEQLAIVSGVVFGFWLGYFTRNIPGSMSWRIPLIVQLIPASILAIGCLILPESPRLLVLKGRIEDAHASLAKLRLRSPEDGIVQLELTEMRIEAMLIQRSYDDINATRNTWKELQAWKRLFSYQYRDRTILSVLIMVFQQWSGINALLYYGPTLVKSVGMSGDSVTLLVSGGIGIVQFIAVIPAILYIDRWGRKPLLRCGAALTFLSHLTIAILVSQFSADWSQHPIAVWTAVSAIYLFTFSYGTSLGPIGWVLPSEVFPLSMRSKGVAIATASNWINNFVIGLITPPLIELSTAGTFLIFSIACFLAYFWATYWVPETANVSLEEMDKAFRGFAGREDGARREAIEEEVGLKELVRRLAEADPDVVGS